jgi:hypothetical protein
MQGASHIKNEQGNPDRNPDTQESRHPWNPDTHEFAGRSTGIQTPMNSLVGGQDLQTSRVADIHVPPHPLDLQTSMFPVIPGAFGCPSSRVFLDSLDSRRIRGHLDFPIILGPFDYSSSRSSRIFLDSRRICGEFVGVWIPDEFVGNLWVSGFLRGLQENAKGFSRPFQGLAWRRSDGRTAQWSIPLVYPPGPLRGKPPSASLLGARRSLPLAPLPSAHCRLFARSLPITRL